MKKLFPLIFLVFLLTPLLAQEEAAEEAPAEGWDIGAGLGLDLAQLLQINPRIGAGQNRIGLGGALTLNANYTKDRLSWDNLGSWQFGVQKLGAGSLPQGDNIPFQKTIDELRLNSKLGYKVSQNSKFSYAANFSFLSLLTPAYPGTDQIPGPLLSDVDNGQVQAKFLSPATVTFSVGIDYKPIEGLSIFYSPLGYKAIYVADDAIAALNVHGNEEGKNSFHNLGSLLRTTYNDKYANDKIIFTSNLILYSNYLMEPQNIDIDWTNEFGFAILEGLQLSVLANLFYDHDVKVQITDNDAPGGINGVGRRVSFTQQLLLKYTRQF